MIQNEKILLLGGTTEAIKIAKNLSMAGNEIITSLVGKTRTPDPVSGSLRIGNFGGIEGMVTWLKNQKIDRVIDASHPFAQKISKHAIEAARQVNIPLQVHTRPPWKKVNGDNWIQVSSHIEAAIAIPLRARVFLALGSQHLHSFIKRDDCYFIIRMIDNPIKSLPFSDYTLITGKPSNRIESEEKLLIQNRVTYIVCRNSGGKKAYSKIKAARNLSLPVIIINYPL
ncbi:cobalt-precorrin-6A reductase [Candidatus Endowatersipora endosymbiont of Watersipora subatra]|uniref:cobalt-precorrin-6A reductase n=1 Tax=Candidatus Endowatersipora endosymbiont of Watersipora subatra TaxID=3077946 RepID=UPI00312C9F5C